MKMPEGPSRFVVPGLLGLAFSGVVYFLVGWKWFLFLGGLLVYEAWTGLNKYANDTISETIWALSKRPLIPFALGAMCCQLLNHIIPPSGEGLWISFMLGVLMGHFVFQAQSVYEANGKE